jgi:hypothetical protein
MAARNVILMFYGIEIEPEEDPYLQMGQKVFFDFVEATTIRGLIMVRVPRKVSTFQTPL